MRRLPVPVVLLIAALLLIATGCSTSNKTRETMDPNTITSEDIEGMPSAVRVQDLLEGRVPGVNVTQTPDGRLQVKIRGNDTFRGDEQPLFVVDGFPVEPDSDGSLPGVTISEIKSIRVLKNPSDTAIYGMRGSHGVIVVTLFKGMRQ